MAGKAPMERHQSIDAQLRLLAPQKLSDDDKLVEYDALLLDRFLDILQDLHGPHLREFVRPDRSHPLSAAAAPDPRAPATPC